ncbi:MAG: NADH-quinone oxidoreductase subunit L [Candidatus Omnitrophica bacterium]|nr:NADH-quinone oxidoreductase subunit L [Candidatus Omnitrophota bacterium]
MMNEACLLSAVFVPVAGAFLTPLAGIVSTRLRNYLSLIFVSASLLCSIAMIPAILAGKAITISVQLPIGFNFILNADGLAVFMAIVSSFIGAIIVLYSFGYISHYPNQNEYYFMVVLFLGSMTGLVYSANLILLYIFWELTALTSWRLIGFFRQKQHVLRADKAFLVTVFGALAMLLGFIFIYQKTGSFDLAVIKSALGTLPLPDIAVALILIGILSKSATLPFHTWLPDAGVAPSPVTALLHAAVLVKIGVYVYARLFIATFAIGDIWHTIVPAIAAASALVSAGAALIETDMKRIIAYSTVSQIAFIFLGFSVGSSIGIAGALLFILMHGLAKGGLFLCAGIVEQNAKTKDITKMGGLMSTMPVTAISFLACSFSIMGLPPFGGFFSKYLVFSGTLASSHNYIAMTFFVGAVLTILYLLRIFNMVFLGESRLGSVREGSRIMVVSVAALATLSLLAGIYIKYPSDFVQMTVKQMLGM